MVWIYDFVSNYYKLHHAKINEMLNEQLKKDLETHIVVHAKTVLHDYDSEPGEPVDQLVVKDDPPKHGRCASCRWYGRGFVEFGDLRLPYAACINIEVDDCVTDPPADFGCIHWKAKE
jgi:hypothetical protein